MASVPLLFAGVAIALATTVAVTELPPRAGAPRGHWILQIEGDALALEVTCVTRKPDPFGHQAGIRSPFAIEIRDAGGAALGRFPLELDRFDLDPAHFGRPPQVAGCEIRDTRVAALANVPDLAGAAELVILRGEAVLGRTAPARLQALLAEERR
jgi:hypothetical protein